MSEDTPTYATTAEEQEQLAEYIRDALEQCVEEGYVAPLMVVLISVNGSFSIGRTDGETVEELARHSEGPGFALPINVLITDARGEATRVLVTNDELRSVN